MRAIILPGEKYFEIFITGRKRSWSEGVARFITSKTNYLIAFAKIMKAYELLFSSIAGKTLSEKHIGKIKGVVRQQFKYKTQLRPDQLVFYKKYFQIILYYSKSIPPIWNKERKEFFESIEKLKKEYGFEAIVVADVANEIEELVEIFNIDIKRSWFVSDKIIETNCFDQSDGKLVEVRWNNVEFNYFLRRKDGRDNQTFELFDDADPDTLYKWSEVKQCLHGELNPANFINGFPCPRCGAPSHQLRWINFKSSPESWRELHGREGPMSICDGCKLQVQFILQLMS